MTDTRAADALRVVPITAALAAGFHACLDAVAREKRFLAQVEAPPLERVQQFVADGLEKDAVQFVALDGEQVVGWADIFPDWAPALAHRGHLGMGLLPAYRGRGLGTRLLSACLAKAAAQGLTRVELEVRVDNTSATALYRKLGFVEEGRKRWGMCFDGVYFDTLLMARCRGAEAG
jgi:ribosomal protein S18 acetylase RimI-like enzyme